MPTRPPIRPGRRTLLLVAATIVALLLAETTIRVTDALNPEVMAGADGHVLVRASDDPILQWELVPGGSLDAEVVRHDVRPSFGECAGDEKTHTIPLRVNRWGFRGPDWSNQPAAGVLRVAVMGDSQTLGEGLLEEETWPGRLASQLEERRPDMTLEVLNFGVLGYNSEQERQLLRQHVLPRHPHLVLVGYMTNDPEPTGASATTERPVGGLLGRSALVRAVSARWAQESLATSRALSAHQTYAQYAVELHSGDSWAAARGQLLGMAADAADAGVLLALVLLPDMGDSTRLGSPDSPYQEVHAVVEGLRDDGVTVLNPLRGFPMTYCDRNRLTVGPRDIHMGPWVADQVARQLAVSNGLDALLLAAAERAREGRAGRTR
jgi:hypothetical protein